MVPSSVSTAPPPRPVEDAYWVVPGRLLVGAYPGSRSRAQAMDRLRQFLAAGVTCFIDLTELGEAAPYDSLLPFETPTGRRVEYLREPIVDHDVPASRDVMTRILSLVDGALGSGHLVYLHCRAGVGRSAMAAGCWLAERCGGGESGLAALSEVWPQAVQSEVWPQIPETEAQAQYVRDWVRADVAVHPRRATYARDGGTAAVPALEQRVRGAWFGLALGDALGAAQARGEPDRGELGWSQHTALTLCAAESLLARRRFDARDQIERFVRWQREALGAGAGATTAAALTPDVAKALATYQWRRLAMAGSHDPSDNAPNSLPRVLAAAMFHVGDPAGALALAAECSRTTHQSPLILDACRLYAATLVGALRGDTAANWIVGLPATTPSCWEGRPLHSQVLASATTDAAPAAVDDECAGVVQALANARRIVAEATTFTSAMQAAWRGKASDYALNGALVGTLYGVRHGVDALPEELRARMQHASTVEAMSERCVRHVRQVLV